MRFPLSKIQSQTMTCPAKIPRWKRTLDVAFGVLIRMVSAGPVLFRQERVGYLGRKFMCFKFRTMFVGAETAAHQGHLQLLMKSNTPIDRKSTRLNSSH